MSETAALSVPPPQQQQESKSAKKKKAKAEAPVKHNAPSEGETGTVQVASEGTVNGADSAYESPYLKELYKLVYNWDETTAMPGLRANALPQEHPQYQEEAGKYPFIPALNKMLLIVNSQNATQKVDSIIAENPNLSLDELLTSRKINQDQKAQAQKKPSLQASLAQLEEQIAQYKQFDEDYQKRLTTEKQALETAHKEEMDKVKDAVAAEARAESQKEAKDNLLTLSKFLRAAAAKRQAGDETSPENRAFEGALLLVYGGEAGAVVAMEQLILGSDEKVPTVDQTPSEFTCKLKLLPCTHLCVS